MYDRHLAEMLKLSRKLLLRAEAIDPNIENNEDGQLEELQLLFEQRQEMIKRISVFIEREGFQWKEPDLVKISELKRLEETLQPLIDGLYKAFSKQLNRINQTKQLSKKYTGAYQNMGTGGAFIDQRK